MRAGSFTAAALLASAVTAMTPPGVFPVNTENMTNYYDTSTSATNGVNIPVINTNIAPTVALDKSINGSTFAIVMFDPDTPATGVGGNGTNSFLHWFQDGLTSDTTQIQIGGPTGNVVFPLVNALHINALQSYIQPGPPEGETHRYTQILLNTTGVTGFVVSPAVGDAIASRQNFDMARFVAESGVQVVSSNFFNVTGVAKTTKRELNGAKFRA